MLTFLSSFYDLLTELVQGNEFAIKCLEKIASYEKFIFVNFTFENFFIFKGRILKIFSIVHFKNLNPLDHSDYLYELLSQTQKELSLYPHFLSEFIAPHHFEMLKAQNLMKFTEEIPDNVLYSKIEYWQMICSQDELLDKDASPAYGLLYFLRDFLKTYGLQILVLSQK